MWLKKTTPLHRVIVLAPVFFVVSLLAACGSVKEPEFREIENLRLARLGFNESTLAFDLHYFNPNKFRVKLKEAEGDIWFDENLLGHFTIDSLVPIPALADFRLPVELKAAMGQLMKNSLAAVFNKEVQVKIQGRAKLGKGLVYISYPIRYEGRQKLGDLLR